MKKLLLSLVAWALCAVVVAQEVEAPPSPYFPYEVDNPELQRAMVSVTAATTLAEGDARRPQYHFRPPAQWMNDPNGPIYRDGYYHMFYQHNPYGDRWDHMHWGHARSRDLVQWEHLPIALWPSKELGENHCFSGSAAVNADNKVMLFYTSIGDRAPEQWAAVPKDDALLTWSKHDQNPILTEAAHGDQRVYEWRDPYIFLHEDQHYMVCGGNMNASEGGQAAVQLYRAENDALTEWSHQGVLFVHPDAEVKNIECPNFFKLQNKWVMIFSAHRAPEYFIGDFNAEKGTFTWETRGYVDHGDYYAPNGCFDEKERHILWGWIRGFDFAAGWNGCLSLPRVLTVSAEGRLLQQPAPELTVLREGEGARHNLVVGSEPVEVPDLESNQFELALKGPGEGELQLTLNTGTEVLATVEWKDTALVVAGVQVPLEGAPKSRDLRLFLDRSVLEVYAQEGEVCITRVIPPLDKPVRIRLQQPRSNSELTVETWPLRSVW